MERVRIKKVLSEMGYCSRREAESLLRAGKVVVNGRVATLGDKITAADILTVKGKKVERGRQAVKKVLLYYKPKGVECTLTPTPAGRTLLDFDFGGERVFPIGRLDRESQGLLLLTNDGELCNRLASPSQDRPEVYRVVSSQAFTEAELSVLQNNISQTPGKDRLLVEITDKGEIQFTQHDARDKFIRRLCKAAGIGIDSLTRIRIGDFDVGELNPGDWRLLGDDEYKQLKEGKATRARRRIIVSKGTNRSIKKDE